jgi:RHS repeat-associated protein
MNERPNIKALVRTAIGALCAAAAMASLSALAQTDATRNGLAVSIPNGYASIGVEDLRVMTTAGPVRFTRSWDGSEWKINPQWESLSQSWKNLTGSQALDTSDGTITRDPSQTTTAQEPTRSNALQSSASGGGGSGEGCWVWVDEDWQPSAGLVAVSAAGSNPKDVPQMAPERIAPFNRAMGDPGSDYPTAQRVSVDFAALCPGGGASAAVNQDFEGLRRNNELYLGSDGRYAFNSRSVMEKRSVRQLPPVASAAPYAALGSGQVSLAPVTLANGYRWIDKSGDWIDYSNRGQMVAWGDRNNNTVWIQRDTDGVLRGVVDANGHVVYTLHYTGVLVTEVRDYPVAGNALDLPQRSVKYGYDAANRLTRVTDARGNDTTYDYDGANRIVKITDAEGRAEQIAYKGELVTQRTAPDGAVSDYAFDYDDANRQLLSKITGPETAAGRMVMDTTHNRAGKLVRRITNGRTDEEVKYDTAARAQTSTNARGFSTRTTKSEFGQVIEVAHPDGATQKASYSSASLEMIDEADELGVRTEYQLDNAGNRLKKTEAVGTPDERTTEYVRNALGQVTRATIKGRTEPNGTVTQDAVWQVEYDSLGQFERVIDPENHTHRFIFDRAGNTARYTDPRNNATRFEVDALGNLTRTTNALGHSTTLAYDKVGNQTTVLDARGKTLQQVYDAMNRRRETINAVGGRRLTQYNGQGLPIRETDEDGRATSFDFDNFQRFAKTVDALAHTTTMSYTVPDGTQAGQIGTLLAPNQVQYPTFTQQTKYDARERPTNQTLIQANAQGSESLVSATTYDRRGQVLTETDAAGKVRRYAYSALGRLIEATDALGNKTRAQYDVRGNLIQLEDAKGNVTRFEYDRNDRLVKETLPLGQTTSYQYDAAGNLAQRTDPLGTRSLYTHDNANRVTLTERRNSANAVQRSTTATWDEANNLTGWSDTDPTRPAGQQTSSATLTYDDANRKTGETVTYPNSTNMSYGYAYSAAGKKTRLTWADGTAIDYGYSQHGEMQTVTIPGEGSISVNQFKWTAPASLTLPGGSVQDKSYNGLLQLESLKVKSPGQQTTLELQNRYGKLQELQDRNRTDTAANVSSTRSENFGYDDEVRLTSAQTSNNGGSASAETFGLDALANRTAHSVIPGAWSYDANNRLIQRGSGANATTYTWDDAGNLSRKTEPGKITRYAYDTQHRLVRVEDGSGNPIARYGYDPMSRRIWKEQYRDGSGNALAQAKRTLYLYADEGLIAEATQDITLNADQSVTAAGSAQITTQYGPMPNSLFGTDVMFVKTKNSNGADSFAYLHRDHLGTPVQATDKAGNVVWAARYEAFGKADIVTPAATASNPTITLNLRLPGQYLDEETGLHYNWHRFYDAQIGRYTQADPIGLRGGINRFAYVNGSPLMYMDPYGLFGWADMPALPDWLVDGAAGFGDTLSFGATGVVRGWMGTDGVVNRCSSAYSNGEWGGLGVSLAFGGAHLGRNAAYQMGRAGGLGTRVGRGAGRLFSDGRTWGSVRDTWSVAAGNGERWLAANGQSLHHWLFPQRFAEINAGFNYMAISAGFNSWMNGTTALRTAVEWGFRGTVAGIYGAPLTAAFNGDDCACQR